MRTQTQTQKIFSFADLETNEKLKELVLKKYADINTNYNFWYEGIIEDFKKVAKIIGLEVSRTYFSGFYSQGNGACFEGYYMYRKNSVAEIKGYCNDNTIIAIAEKLQQLQKKCFFQCHVEISHRGHYFHENSMYYQLDSNDYFCQKQTHNLQEEFEDVFCNLAKWLYNNLEREYNYLSSESAILQNLELNEYEFFENGSIV